MMRIESDAIRECPFCGGEPALINDGGAYCIVCDAHDCLGYVETEYFDAKDDAISAWNTRAERTCRDISLDRSTQFYCSECECTVEVPLLFGTLNYCPNCGRKVACDD